jgi:rSAM/selenodomain-associated transferase 2
MESPPETAPALAVVVPTLDEERRIASCLSSIGIRPEIELVVTDGGSSDRTLEIVRDLRPDATVVDGSPGRGGQLRRGAAAATADRLLFLHADCTLPEGWLEATMEALDDPETALAVFELHTRPTDGPVPGVWRRFWLSLFDLRSRGWGLPYGDQGFALRRSVYDALGGFRDIPLMEDVALARLAVRKGAIHSIPLRISTTARRFEERPIRSRVILATFPTLFRLGVSPDRLARWYGVIR